MNNVRTEPAALSGRVREFAVRRTLKRYAVNMHLKTKWIDRRIYEYFATNMAPILGLYERPVLVYQMGKVGSSSIRNSLFRSSAPETDLVLMSHEFFPIRNRSIDNLTVDESDRGAALREIEHDRDVFNRFSIRKRLGWRFREKFYTEKIHKNYVRSGRPIRVITLVREPIANNVSMFFQILDHYAGVPYEKANLSTEQLITMFLDRYMHTRPLTWLDAELGTMLGIDVYAYEFPKDKGYLAIKENNIDLLVMKCELSDREKESAIKSFLDIDEFEIVHSNVSSNKSYAKQYEEFKRSIRVPDRLADEMYTSKYAQHFYSDTDLARFRARWQKLKTGA